MRYYTKSAEEPSSARAEAQARCCLLQVWGELAGATENSPALRSGRATMGPLLSST